MHDLKNRTILHGDVLEKLKEIPDNSIDVVITSPPYYQLRSYQVKGQIGLEKTIPEYIVKLMEVMEGCRRVLKGTGTIWVNLGDTYEDHSGGRGRQHQQPKSYLKRVKFIDPEYESQVRAKSLLGIPERFMVACIDAGWICRNHIPWIKDNTLPSSVKDRFRNTWEHIIFLSKEGKYYANLDNVRIPCTTPPSPTFNYRVQRIKQGQITPDVKASQTELISTDQHGYVKQLTKQDIIPDSTGKPKPTVSGFNERWRASREGLTKKDFVDRPGDAPIQSGLSSCLLYTSPSPRD